MYGFEEGDKVRILSSDKTTNTQYKHTINLIGTVKRFKYSSIGVKFNEINNRCSNQGLFWYKSDEVKIIKNKSEEENMRKLTGYEKVAVVDCGYDHKYYFALYDDDVEAGDLVYTNNTGDKVLVVHSVISSAEAASRYSKEITKEVICKLDMSAFNERMARRDAKRELQKQMDLMIKQMDEVNKYKIYAESNPELAELLSEYQSL